MRTLYRAISGKEVGGEPLPLTFKSLQQNEIVLRRAELNLIAGTPGAGKSSIALAIAVQAQVPTLYMSADTNAHTMGMRVVAMATGMTQSNAGNNGDPITIIRNGQPQNSKDFGAEPITENVNNDFLEPI